jgi:hypothetical protein
MNPRAMATGVALRTSWRDNADVKTSEAPTIKAKRSPVILLVGLDAQFVGRCQDAAIKVNATVESVEAGGESTFAMQTLPIAIVMHQRAVSASPLGTIARELGIELIAIPDEGLPEGRIEQLVTEAVGTAHERWRVTRP